MQALFSLSLSNAGLVWISFVRPHDVALLLVNFHLLVTYLANIRLSSSPCPCHFDGLSCSGYDDDNEERLGTEITQLAFLSLLLHCPHKPWSSNDLWVAF